MRIAGIVRGLVTIMVLVAHIPFAFAEVEILETSGYLQHWVLYGSSHGPCEGASWSHDASEGIGFDLRAVGFEDGCIGSTWTGRAAPEGITFTGLMPEVEPKLQSWLLFLQAEISVQIQVQSPTQILASRQAAGVFGLNRHHVTVELPDGQIDYLLGPEDSATSAERVLDPGTYRLAFTIDESFSHPDQFLYSGVVAVSWLPAVSTDSHSWSALKKSYLE